MDKVGDKVDENVVIKGEIYDDCSSNGLGEVPAEQNALIYSDLNMKLMREKLDLNDQLLRRNRDIRERDDMITRLTSALESEKRRRMEVTAELTTVKEELKVYKECLGKVPTQSSRGSSPGFSTIRPLAIPRMAVPTSMPPMPYPNTSMPPMPFPNLAQMYGSYMELKEHYSQAALASNLRHPPHGVLPNQFGHGIVELLDHHPTVSTPHPLTHSSSLSPVFNATVPTLTQSDDRGSEDRLHSHGRTRLMKRKVAEEHDDEVTVVYEKKH